MIAVMAMVEPLLTARTRALGVNCGSVVVVASAVCVEGEPVDDALVASMLPVSVALGCRMMYCVPPRTFAPFFVVWVRQMRPSMRASHPGAAKPTRLMTTGCRSKGVSVP